MPGPTTVYFRLRIKNAAGTADQIVITSVRGGTNPYIKEPPHGDGATYNPMSGESMLGAYTLLIADWALPGTTPVSRVMTSQLEAQGTDADGFPTYRQQLAYRRCILDMGFDGVTWPIVLVAGVLSLLRLVDAMTYEVTIQDPMRAMEQVTLFAPSLPTRMGDWFAAFPFRGCLAGGPMMQPAGTVPDDRPLGLVDLGGWEWRVEQLIPGANLGFGHSSPYYVLRPRIVYGPPKWEANTRSNLSDFAPQINEAAAKYQTVMPNHVSVPWETIEDAMTKGSAWTGITWLIDKHDGQGFVPWKPYPFDQFFVWDPTRNAFQWNSSLIGPPENWGIGAMPGPGQTLPIGALVKVRALTVLPTEQCPLYLKDNPTVLLAQFLTSANIPFNQASLDQLRATMTALGNMTITFRITAPKPLKEMIDQIVLPLGIGIRGNTAGELEFFDGRLGSVTTLPTVQITDDDIIDGTTSLPFELDPSRAVVQITFTQTRMVNQLTAPHNSDTSIIDGIILGTDTLTMKNGDVGAIPFGTLDWKTDGMCSIEHVEKMDWTTFVTSQARSIFDRFGWGGVAFETTLIRGGAGEGLNLGDEALINVPQIPNHNYRLGDNPAIAARRMQITRRTVLPEGYAVRFEDSGPYLQPLDLVPVLTIAAAADSVRNGAIVTITNAAQLNTAKYGARLQVRVTPIGGPPATFWTDVAAWGAGLVPSTVRLPAVFTGATVEARARSEAPPHLPSSWSVPVSVTLTSIAAPTDLSVVVNATDGSLATLHWTIGAGADADLVDVWRRAAGDPAIAATRVMVLNPGSTQYMLEGLTPNTAYTASVQHRDPRTGDTSALTEITFTTANVSRTLSAPVNPAPFAGVLNPLTGAPNRDGTFGIGVLAAEFPSFLEVQIAVETAVGSGVYGPWETRATQPTIPSVLGNWTTGIFVAPNDGLHRQLRARHVLDGCVPSAYTAPVTVLPWTPLPLPPLPADLIIIEVTALPPLPPSDAGAIFRFQATAIDSAGQPTEVAITGLGGTGVAIVDGPPIGVFAPNDTIWKVSLPPSGAGPGSMTVQGRSADGRLASTTLILPEIATGAELPSIALDVVALAPSPSTDAGIYFRFQANAVDSGGLTTEVGITSVTGTGVAITSGPAVGVFGPSGTIWKVSLPPSGAGPGTIVVQGRTADGRHTNASLTIPEVASPGKPGIITEITGLTPSPPSDAGVYFRFLVHAFTVDGSGTATTVAVTSLTGTGVSIVSGAGVGTFVPDNSIWKVSLPPSGAGPGSLTVQGQTADGRKSAASMSLPEVAAPGPLVPPGIQEQTSETPPGSNPMTGTLTITVTDPELRVTTIRFRTQSGNGAWSGYTSFPGPPASISVILIESHISKIEYEVYADFGVGAVLYFRAVVPFSTGSIPTAPNLEATFDGNGFLTVTITGDSDTASTALGASLVSAADAFNHFSGIVNGRIAQYVNVLQAASGQRAYIAAYAWPQVNGGGIQSVAAQTTKDREGAGTQTPSGTITKRQRMSGVELQPSNAGGIPINYTKTVGGGILNYNPNDAFSETFFAAIQLPPGVTITVFRARLGSANANAQADLYLFRPDGAGGATQVGQLVATRGSGTNVYAQSMSEGPTGDTSYTVELFLAGAQGSSGVALLQWFEIEYQMPSYDKTI